MTGDNNNTNLRTIAEAAGVSISTVSRVLSGQTNVRKATREKVLAVSQKMRYRPNLLVRGIQTGRTGMIGVMIRPTTPFAARLLMGIHDTLCEADCVPIVLWAPRQPSPDGPTELDQIHRLVDRRVDGVILSPVEDTASDTYLHEIWERNIPLVTVDRQLQHSQAHFVGCDDYAVGTLAAQTLLELGHRRIGHLAGPATTSTGRLRRTGFAETIAEVADTELTVVEEASFVEGYRGGMQLLLQKPRPTAIFAANNSLALGVYDAAAELRIKVPEELSIIGCGVPTLASDTHPRLTMIDQHAYEIGQIAADVLLECLDAKAPTDQIVRRLAPSLTRGKSTRPLATTQSSPSA